LVNSLEASRCKVIAGVIMALDQSKEGISSDIRVLRDKSHEHTNPQIKGAMFTYFGLDLDVVDGYGPVWAVEGDMQVVFFISRIDVVTIDGRMLGDGTEVLTVDVTDQEDTVVCLDRGVIVDEDSSISSTEPVGGEKKCG
jgi:hypothetical protein